MVDLVETEPVATTMDETVAAVATTVAPTPTKVKITRKEKQKNKKRLAKEALLGGGEAKDGKLSMSTVDVIR
jgi:hypothetical protein